MKLLESLFVPLLHAWGSFVHVWDEQLSLAGVPLPPPPTLTAPPTGQVVELQPPNSSPSSAASDSVFFFFYTQLAQPHTQNT